MFSVAMSDNVGIVGTGVKRRTINAGGLPHGRGCPTLRLPLEEPASTTDCHPHAIEDPPAAVLFNMHPYALGRACHLRRSSTDRRRCGAGTTRRALPDRGCAETELVRHGDVGLEPDLHRRDRGPERAFRSRRAAARPPLARRLDRRTQAQLRVPRDHPPPRPLAQRHPPPGRAHRRRVVRRNGRSRSRPRSLTSSGWTSRASPRTSTSSAFGRNPSCRSMAQ